MADTRIRFTGRMVLGLVVMALGALWTLDNLNLVESEPILRWWPAVLVLFGVARLTGFCCGRHPIAGVLFVLVGVWMLAGSLDFVRVSVWEFWPLVLVVLGVRLLTRSMAHQRQQLFFEDASSQLHAFAFLSGVERKAVSPQFRGGEATAVMGGCTLDLRGAKPVSGGAVLELFVWWGGIDLIVPDHWRIVNEATALLGAVEDKSKIAPLDSQDILIVRGLVIMGGVEIKN